MTEQTTSIIIFAHGSKVPEANETITRLARDLSASTGQPARAAFLEVAQPDLNAAVAEAVGAGAGRVVIVPCFLVFGVHVRQDLPRLARALESVYPNVEIIVSEPLEGHPGLAEILASRVRQSLSAEAAGSRRREKS